MEGDQMKEEKLPPGFRFHPTDEELITSYLVNKISDSSFTGRAIGDVDLNKCEPWDLPGKAKMGEKEWYFFSLRDRKYPTGVRTNRATNTGYWKTTGKDKEIYNSVSLELIGMKKTLVFYKGRAPRGEKSNWVMHEYRIHSKSSYRTTKQDEWVVCRVFQKSASVKKYISNHSRSIIPTYNLEMNPSSSHISPHVMHMHPSDNHHFQFPIPRSNHTTTYADLQELSKVFRGAGGAGGGGSGGGLSTFSLPIQPHLNYSVGGGVGLGGAGAGAGGGNCFTVSGLNLNLGGSGSGLGTAQPMMRPMPQHGPAMNQHDANSAAMMSNIAMQNEAAGYGVEMNNHGNAMGGNRFIPMDHCADLDNYWTSYN